MNRENRETYVTRVFWSGDPKHLTEKQRVAMYSNNGRGPVDASLYLEALDNLRMGDRVVWKMPQSAMPGWRAPIRNTDNL